jgi:hypothetical protein
VSNCSKAASLFDHVVGAQQVAPFWRGRRGSETLERKGQAAPGAGRIQENRSGAMRFLP